MSTTPAQRDLLLVTVGSDHHPFDRLITWVDAWLHDGGADHVDCFMQYGTARKPARADGEAFVAHADLLELMTRATAVVTQGGPMGIIEAGRAGHRPVVVPRIAALGEVVDDHQFAFAHHMAARGDILVATSEAELRRLLDQLVDEPTAFARADDAAIDNSAGIADFARIADEVLLAPPRRFAPLRTLMGRQASRSTKR